VAKVKVKDIEMYYELHGTGDPVVLIQGLGGNHTFWEPNLPELTKKHKIILLDYRGSGDTDKPNMPYSTRQFADDIAGLMSALGIEKAHIVGRSMGGCIGQWLGIDHPEKVRSLLLAATWARADGCLKMMLANWSKIVEMAGVQGLLEQVLPWCWTRGFFEPEKAEELETLKKMVFKNRQPADAFARQSKAGQDHDARSELSKIKSPTLVAVGDADILTPPSLSEELVKAIPGAKLRMVPGYGHAFYEERPDIFNEICLEFWAKH
jgi:pimeloyl-ACP methyl ester carboxylesterase